MHDYRAKIHPLHIVHSKSAFSATTCLQKAHVVISLFNLLQRIHDNEVSKGGMEMKIRKQILDFEYEEVLDAKTRELIRTACAVTVGCPV